VEEVVGSKMWMMLTKQWHDLLLGHYLVSTGYCSVSDLVEGSPMQCSDFPDYRVLVRRNYEALIRRNL